jgi:hypothetical protein
MNKMTLQDLKGMYMPPPIHYISPDGLEDKSNRTHSGSKRRHRHTHKATYKPPKVGMSPAEYRRQHLGARAK